MKTMIQILILAVILTPAATYANPHSGKHHSNRPVHGKPVSKPQPVRRPGPGPVRRPTPGPKPPAPNPPHRKHRDHDHHHGHHGHHQQQTRVIYVAGAGHWCRGPVVQQTTHTAPVQPPVASQPVLSTQAPSTQVLSTREFLLGRDLYRGQRVAICGKVTQIARSLVGVNYVILDGAVRCEFPRDIRGGNAPAATDQHVTIVGLATGGWHATASADLVECARPF